jgi:hypothetical protein
MRIAPPSAFGLFAALLFLSPVASAESAKAIFEKHGLFGTWAADCTRPVGSTNPYVVYRPVAGGSVRREVFIEPDRPFDVSTPQSAVESADDELIVIWQTGEGGIANRIRLRPDEMQVIDSTRQNGEKLTVGGRRVRDNTATPRYRRCGRQSV